MSKRWKVDCHLGQEEIERNYQTANSECAKIHWQIIRLSFLKKTAREIAEIVGFACASVERILSRYIKFGPDALGDRRRNNGGTRMLSPELEQELATALEEPPKEGGLWNSPKVSAWIAKKLNRPTVHRARGWEYLKRLGMSLKQPRPSHVKSCKIAQETFKKNCHP